MIYDITIKYNYNSIQIKFTIPKRNATIPFGYGISILKICLSATHLDFADFIVNPTIGHRKIVKMNLFIKKRNVKKHGNVLITNHFHAFIAS